MTLDEFWKTIENARRVTAKLVDVPPYLVNELSRLDEREIIDFGKHFRDCMDLSYDANVWLGAVVIIGGCGDDRFSDFRCWLIAQGRKAFESALEDPDSMAALENFDGDYDYPILFHLNYVAQEAFCKRIAGDPKDFKAGERFESLSPVYKHPALKNEELVQTSDADAKALFPKLAARFPDGIRAEIYKAKTAE